MKDVKAIKVETYYPGEKDAHVSYISMNQYTDSFINERWPGERRTQKRHTIFGEYPTRITVTNPFNGEKTIRDFTFPESVEAVRELQK